MPVLGRSFVDPVFRVPRNWSNDELRKIGGLFAGDVVNVSAWRDEDKAGGHYRDYFPKAASYSLTNFNTDDCGLQGAAGEVFLNLEADLPGDLRGRFDVVFNHTTLEHVVECRKAFANLCAMSRDVVIVVLPFLQPYHANYGDFWRFSPTLAARLFEENGFTPARIVWNEDPQASIYVFAVGVRDPAKYAGTFEFGWDQSKPDANRLPENFAGRHAFPAPTFAARVLRRLTGAKVAAA